MSTHPTDEQLSAFSDARLDGSQMRFVARHLNECAACQRSADSLRNVRETLRTLPPPAAPDPAFWDDALRRMRVHQHEQFQREQPRPALFFVSARRRWAAGAALTAVFCAVLSGPLVQNDFHPANETAPAEMADTVDVSSLMVAHTRSAARQPLADADRQTLLAVDGDPLLADSSNPDAPR